MTDYIISKHPIFSHLLKETIHIWEQTFQYITDLQYGNKAVDMELLFNILNQKELYQFCLQCITLIQHGERCNYMRYVQELSDILFVRCIHKSYSYICHHQFCLLCTAPYKDGFTYQHKYFGNKEEWILKIPDILYTHLNLSQKDTHQTSELSVYISHVLHCTTNILSNLY